MNDWIERRIRPSLAVVVCALALLALTFRVAGSRPETEATEGGASIQLTKTVNTDPAVCATSDSITVTAGRIVTYCYEIENTGSETLTLHTLADDQLGVLLAGVFQTLTPGSTFAITETAQIFETTVNTATWTAVGDGGSAVDSDTATVIIAEPSIELTKTVGTDPPPACATRSSIEVPTGTDVTYCYEVRNTGNVSFDLHDLLDDQLGTLQTDLQQPLGPGATLQVTVAANIAATTVNSATWTARDPFFAQANAIATVVTNDLLFADGFESGDLSAW